MKNFFLPCVVLLSFYVSGVAQTNEFIRGADVSFTPQIESLGGKYYLDGVEKDALDILKQNGVNYIRLRIWHTPAGGWCGLDQTVAYAKRVKEKGLKFLLDFHYSDWWADPGKQNKPAAWVGASYSALKESVYTYTKYVIEALKNQNALPDMVQIGNEITPGMLWPEGRNNTTQGWIQFGELVKEGIRGAKDGAADSLLKIMIHIDRGGDNATARWFYDNLIAQGVQFDVIGLSYYPWWHGSLTAMKNNVNDLAARYGKQIVIAETAYPWTTQSVNDGHGNISVNASALPKGYSISPQGQKAFIAKVVRTLKEVPNNKGLGFFYWEPTYISVSPIGSSWEHLTVFDFSGSALSSVNSFLNLDLLKQITVKLRVNTATLWDSLKSTGVVQLRGEIFGKGSSLLPSGELVTWDTYTGIVPQNIGGDYWEHQFKMYEGDHLEYKFWTGHDINTPTKFRLGYEGPVTPSDSSNRNIRLVVAGANDTTLDLQFYNSSGFYVNQYWTPIQHKEDSVGILFRVTLADLMKTGIFDPSVHGPVTVRGDSMQSKGVLLWSASNVVMQRETLSSSNGSFWSGVAYFPKTIAVGAQINYKFYVENSSFGGWENAIEERTFSFPLNDTTLVWKYFNERNPVTTVEGYKNTLPLEFQLHQNYPNPFNPSTTIRYSVPVSATVKITIYNLLGQPVKELVNNAHHAGEFTIKWDGADFNNTLVHSGVYFVRLESGSYKQVRKIVFVK